MVSQLTHLFSNRHISCIMALFNVISLVSCCFPADQNASPILAPPPSISNKPADMPVAAPANKTAYPYAPPSHWPTEGSLKIKILTISLMICFYEAMEILSNVVALSAPTANNHLEAPPPRGLSKSNGSHSPIDHHHEKAYNITPAPLADVVPPLSSDSLS